MVDDHKYSVRRIVVYRHPDPGHPRAAYGPGGPERTYGLITAVRLVEDVEHRWEYTIRNSLTSEVRQVAEAEIFHGANRGYLDLYRRDAIFWSQRPSELADTEAARGFWRRALRHFIRTGVSRMREREDSEERARREGCGLPLAPGDYVKLRGDFRREPEPIHNMYARILSASPADVECLEGLRGPDVGKHRVLSAYHVLLDNGGEADVYDVEVKTVYTLNGRTTILNWRAATFLAEAFGDDPPYNAQLEYLNGHVFTRAELEGMSKDELADLLTRILYVKGQIMWEEFGSKLERLSKSPAAYLVDQILANSRFDMEKNRPLTPQEIEKALAEDQRLRDLFE